MIVSPYYMKSDDERISDKIDALVRNLYYKNKPTVVNDLCILKARLHASRKLSDKERKATVVDIEKQVSALQLTTL